MQGRKSKRINAALTKYKVLSNTLCITKKVNTFSGERVHRVDDKELQQFEIDEAKAKEGPFGFRVGNDERLHAGENIQEQAGHMSSSYTSKEAQKAEAKKEQQKHAIHTMLNQYGLSNHVADLLHEVEKLREDEQKLEQEKSDLITEDAILEKETRILEVRKDILSKQIEAIEMICDEEMCMIDHDLAAIRENIEQIDTLKEEFAKQDPEAYRAYKEHRHLAKEIISLKIKPNIQKKKKEQ